MVLSNDNDNDTNNKESKNNKIINDVSRIDTKNKNKSKFKKRNKKKIDEDSFCIPTFEEYEKLNKFDYKLTFLKDICKNYKLKRSGNKDELNSRIYIFLYKSYYINKIQKLWKKFLLYKYNTLRGPARLNRKLCINETDFYTLEEINDIPYNQFLQFY